MKALITGSRGWRDKEIIRAYLRPSLRFPLGVSYIAHGGARGADRLVGEVAIEEQRIAQKVYRADWGRYGKRAGIIRNAEMLADFMPDVVLAFWDGKSRGTKHMIGIAKARGYRVHIIYDDGVIVNSE